MLGTNPISSEPIASQGWKSKIYTLLLTTQLQLQQVIKKQVQVDYFSEMTLTSSISKVINKVVDNIVELKPKVVKSVGITKFHQLELQTFVSKLISSTKATLFQLSSTYTALPTVVELWRELNVISVIKNGSANNTAFITKHVVAIKDYVKHIIKWGDN